MSTIFFLIWLGGMREAYRKDRLHFGRLRSGIEALAWPCGLGFTIARRFYENEDWPR